MPGRPMVVRREDGDIRPKYRGWWPWGKPWSIQVWSADKLRWYSHSRERFALYAEVKARLDELGYVQRFAEFVSYSRREGGP